MTNLNQRDEALKAIAEDAAAVGETGLVKQALEKFTVANLKDEAAASCALTLSAAGKDQAAVEVAKVMSNVNKRDEVLQKIAKGKQ